MRAAYGAICPIRRIEQKANIASLKAPYSAGLVLTQIQLPQFLDARPDANERRAIG